MNTDGKFTRRNQSLQMILLAGFCGGMAEILWITIYGSLSSVSPSNVAREVTASIFPGLAGLSWAPALGIAIHLLLSLALGVVLGGAIRSDCVRRLGTSLTSTVILALIGVWAVNFFIVLPVLNPAFITLMPLGVSLVSKMLFGAAMAAVMQLQTIKTALRLRPYAGLAR